MVVLNNSNVLNAIVVMCPLLDSIDFTSHYYGDDAFSPQQLHNILSANGSLSQVCCNE